MIWGHQYMEKTHTDHGKVLVCWFWSQWRPLTSWPTWWFTVVHINAISCTCTQQQGCCKPSDPMAVPPYIITPFAAQRGSYLSGSGSTKTANRCWVFGCEVMHLSGKHIKHWEHLVGPPYTLEHTICRPEKGSLGWLWWLWKKEQINSGCVGVKWGIWGWYMPKEDCQTCPMHSSRD